MSLLDVANLRKAFGNLVAVDDISFQVSAGEVFGLLGPNGAGKSTTMMMICGLLQPDRGGITLDGQAFHPRNRKLRSVMGVVPQDLAVYPELTGRENLQFFGKLYGLGGSMLDSRVEIALDRVGLSERADDATGKYSGGMKRRLNFAVALLHEPRLLILDEPTVGVDPQSRSHLLDCVRELCAEGMAAIYASHYMEEVEAICHRVAIMDHGKILADDTLSALLSRMASELMLRVAPPSEQLVSELADLTAVRVATADSVMTITITVAEESAAASLQAVASHRQRRSDSVLVDDDSGDIHPEASLAPADMQAMTGGKALAGTLNRILDLLEVHSVRLLSVETHEPNLERLFLDLTGRRLRN